jgi:hypothetical protein
MGCRDANPLAAKLVELVSPLTSHHFRFDAALVPKFDQEIRDQFKIMAIA